MRKIKKSIHITALAAAAAISLSACAGTNPVPDSIKIENQKEHSILVQSTEEVKVVPDVAEIQFAITTQAADPKSCQDQNSQDLDRVITFLKESGIKEESIQTSSYGLDPVYDWNTGREITGYEMRTGITVSDIPMEETGGLLSSCVEAGINNISQVTYLSSEYDAKYQEALKKAIESAKVKASALAEAGGNSLGNMINVEEFINRSEARYTGYTEAGSAENMAKSAAMSVEPGQISVEAQIAVTFEIN